VECHRVRALGRDADEFQLFRIVNQLAETTAKEG
jgi:hypothetical protein